jgi:ABC-type Fe3+/spermidine/putrescine transport system ATPase subunit
MLEVRDLTKRYGNLVAVEDLSFRIEPGEFTTLLGPSGCGKSTTLHAIAGLIEPTDGSVHLRGDDVTSEEPYERNIGMVFQHSALFPHMTVDENVRYGLQMKDFEGDHDAQVEKYLDMVEMLDHADHKPDELSGGQQRRISFARSLAYEPDILLLDEPLTGLDRVLREQMREEIRTIHEEVGITTLHVTHDQAEALSMSDRIVVLNEGRKQQEATPDELYESPETQFVAEFVGQSTAFEGRVVDTQPPTVEAGDLRIQVGDDHALDDGDQVSLYVRPELTSIEMPATAGGEPNTFSGTVTGIRYVGHRAELDVELEDGSLFSAFCPTSKAVAKGDDVAVHFDPDEVIVL